MKRLRGVLLIALLAACGGSGGDTDSRDAILNGTSESTSNTFWFTSSGIEFRIALYSDGTSVQQLGILGNGTRATFPWAKVAPDMIVVDTSGGVAGRCYLSTIRAISGSFDSGSFSAIVDENGCNTGFGMTFTLIGGDVPY